MNRFDTMTLPELLRPEGWDCACGRHHACGLRILEIGPGAVQKLPQALQTLSLRKPFVVCDANTEAAAWPQVRAALEGAGIPYAHYVFPHAQMEPDEHAVGCLTMAFDRSCDAVLAVGSGVINDCCKVLAHSAGLPALVVATAPSMDGYASNSSSMIRNRVKVTLYNACPVAILADTDILTQAPTRMLWAGLGDMLAKYIALCEWRIAHLVTGEYYCENIAGLMRAALARIVAAAPSLMDRKPETLQAITEGLVLSGVAMAFAQVSRPASGLEHYFSHMWEMMALDRGAPYELHGIQVGVGTLLTFQIHDALKALTPDRGQAEAFMKNFDPAAWEAQTRRIFGQAAQAIIDAANREGRNDPKRHQARLEKILEHWGDIQAILAEELPPREALQALMEGLGMPRTPADLGLTRADTQDALVGSRDIRDKYIASSLLWDLGLLGSFEM